MRLPVRRLVDDEVFGSRPNFTAIDASPLIYRRSVRAGGEVFYDLVAIVSSQKHHLFEVSVRWGLFPHWIGHSVIGAERLLPLLCGRRQLGDQQYTYDGTEAGARVALAEVARDLRDCADPWFEGHTRDALANQVLIAGLGWVRTHPEARSAKQGFQYDASVREALSRFLRHRAREIDASPAIKKSISLMCYELLAFATEVDGRPVD